MITPKYLITVYRDNRWCEYAKLEATNIPEALRKTADMMENDMFLRTFTCVMVEEDKETKAARFLEAQRPKTKKPSLTTV